MLSAYAFGGLCFYPPNMGNLRRVAVSDGVVCVGLRLTWERKPYIIALVCYVVLSGFSGVGYY